MNCSIHGPGKIIVGIVPIVFEGLVDPPKTVHLKPYCDQCEVTSVKIVTDGGHLSDLLLDGRQCTNSVVVSSLIAMPNENGDAAKAEFGVVILLATGEEHVDKGNYLDLDNGGLGNFS